MENGLAISTVTDRLPECRETLQPHLAVKLFDHQVEGIEKFLKFKEGFANFGEPGTGKTLQAIGAMNILRQRGMIHKVLIICPKSIKAVWANEFEKSTDSWKIKVLGGTSKEKKLFIKTELTDVFIVNYDSVKLILTELNQWRPDLVIIDEAHAIKNHRAQRTKAVKGIKSALRWAMTGTPIIQNPLDIWSIFDWIKSGLFSPNFYAFRNRYCVIWSGAGFPLIKGFKNLPEMKEKCDRYSWRVLKSECLDLPEKIWTVREFELSEEERKIYKDMAEEMIAEIGKEEITASTALVRTLRLQQITGGAIPDMKDVTKLKVLEELLDELAGQKVVIFCRFKEEIRRIKMLCATLSRPYVVMTGEEGEHERAKAIEEFQKEDGKDTIFLATIQTGGLGITLTAASHCVYYSNSWSLGDRIQSSDRLHRIGQKNSVTYYDLAASGTIDKKILKVLSKKESLSDRITGDDLRKIVYDR